MQPLESEKWTLFEAFHSQEGAKGQILLWEEREKLNRERNYKKAQLKIDRDSRLSSLDVEREIFFFLKFSMARRCKKVDPTLGGESVAKNREEILKRHC